MPKEITYELSDKTFAKLKDIAGTDPIEVNELPKNPSNYGIYRIYKDETIPQKFFNFDVYLHFNGGFELCLVSNYTNLLTDIEDYLNNILVADTSQGTLEWPWPKPTHYYREDWESLNKIIITDPNELIGLNPYNNNIFTYLGKFSITDIKWFDSAGSFWGLHILMDNDFINVTIKNNLVTYGERLGYGMNQSGIIATVFEKDLNQGNIIKTIINHKIDSELPSWSYMEEHENDVCVAGITNPTKIPDEYLYFKGNMINLNTLPIDSDEESNNESDTPTPTPVIPVTPSVT